MSKKFLDDDTLFRFVSSEYYAQCIESESGIGMSWVDMGGSEELEEALSDLPEEDQEEFEKDLKDAASNPEIAGCFKEMDELLHIGEDEDENEEDEDSEDRYQHLEELRSEAMDLMRDQLGDYLK